MGSVLSPVTIFEILMRKLINYVKKGTFYLHIYPKVLCVDSKFHLSLEVSGLC